MSSASRTPRLLPVAALALFSPLMAEFVLGDQYLSGTMNPGQQIGEFVLFVLWYGAGAVLIRELARRTGRGWPTILLLGLGFALVEEGLLTQSLFNPHYLGLDLISYGHVGWLGTALPWAIFVLSIHVVWSIATPIALIEAIFSGPVSGPAPERFRASHPDLTGHPTPWLGRAGLGIAAAVMLLGGAATFAISWAMGGHFLAHPAQLVGAALLAASVVTIAFLLRPRAVRPVRPWPPALLAGLVLSTGYQLLRYYLPGHVDAWITTLVMIAVLALAIVLAAVLRLDVTGLAAGAALTYGWVGMIAAVPFGVPGIVEQSVIVAVVLAVVVLALVRRGRRGEPIADDRAGTADQNSRSSDLSIPRSAS